jgi:hypothetical protein
MSSWLQQQPPLIFMRRLRLHSMTRTLSYTAKYNSSPIVTGLYKYSTQYLINSTLANIPPTWICLARTSMYTRLESPLLLYQELPEETLLYLQFPTPWLHVQLCSLFFYHHNLCQAKLDSSPAKQQLNLTPCSTRLHPWYWEPHNHHWVTHRIATLALSFHYRCHTTRTSHTVVSCSHVQPDYSSYKYRHHRLYFLAVQPFGTTTPFRFMLQ